MAQSSTQTYTTQLAHRRTCARTRNTHSSGSWTALGHAPEFNGLTGLHTHNAIHAHRRGDDGHEAGVRGREPDEVVVPLLEAADVVLDRVPGRVAQAGDDTDDGPGRGRASRQL